MQRIYNLVQVSDDPVLLTTRPGFSAADHHWIRILDTKFESDSTIAEMEQEAIHTFARGIIGDGVLNNSALRKRPGWQPWTDSSNELTMVYETPIGLLIRLAVQGQDPRNGLDPSQFMAPALSLVQQITVVFTSDSHGDDHLLVLPGSCGGGIFSFLTQSHLRFTKLLLNEIPYLADVTALALQFIAAALNIKRVEIPGDCTLFANVTSREGIFLPAEPNEDTVATTPNHFRALRISTWPMITEGSQNKFRAPSHALATYLDLVRFSRPETRPNAFMATNEEDKKWLRQRLLPSVYVNIPQTPPHSLAKFPRLESVAKLWDIMWRETKHRPPLRPGERPHSVDSQLHVPFGLDSHVHVHDMTNTLDQLDRGRLRLPNEIIPSRILVLTDYRHPLQFSQPAVEREIQHEIEMMVELITLAQEEMPELKVLFTLPLIEAWRRVTGKDTPPKLYSVRETTSLWQV
jgi:hypothetical protein